LPQTVIEAGKWEEVSALVMWLPGNLLVLTTFASFDKTKKVYINLGLWISMIFYFHFHCLPNL
jgi:hypothetical protein